MGADAGTCWLLGRSRAQTLIFDAITKPSCSENNSSVRSQFSLLEYASSSMLLQKPSSFVNFAPVLHSKSIRLFQEASPQPFWGPEYLVLFSLFTVLLLVSVWWCKRLTFLPSLIKQIAFRPIRTTHSCGCICMFVY